MNYSQFPSLADIISCLVLAGGEGVYIVSALLLVPYFLYLDLHCQFGRVGFELALSGTGLINTRLVTKLPPHTAAA